MPHLNPPVLLPLLHVGPTIYRGIGCLPQQVFPSVQQREKASEIDSLQFPSPPYLKNYGPRLKFYGYGFMVLWGCTTPPTTIPSPPGVGGTLNLGIR
jgi:hypothetical protein